ncbi:MAG: DUF4412 domain-containing protein [Clostridiales bacterium]|nr:DUF4412 domain-containing protein [Clostridiales bacterium]
MKKVLAVFFSILILAAFASADVYIKSKMHSDAFSMMGQSQPAKDETIEQWFGDDKFANLSTDMSMIVDLSKNVMYLIDHKEKTYVEAKLPLDFMKLLPPEVAQMMGAMMKVTVTVTPTGQTKTIGQWKCSGYDVALQMMMMPMKIAVWATTDVPMDMQKFANMYANVLKAQLRLDDAAVQEMMKIKGYWISSETTGEVMGAKIRSTTEVIEITKKTPDPSVYSVPAGYKKTEFLDIKSMR